MIKCRWLPLWLLGILFVNLPVHANEPVIEYDPNFEIKLSSARSQLKEYKDIERLIRLKIENTQSIIKSQIQQETSYKIVEKPAARGSFNYTLNCKWDVFVDDVRVLRQRDEETNEILQVRTELYMRCDLRDADFGNLLTKFKGEYIKNFKKGDTLNLQELVDDSFYKFRRDILPTGKMLQETIDTKTRVIHGEMTYAPHALQKADGNSQGIVKIIDLDQVQDKGRGPWGESLYTTNMISKYRLTVAKGTFLNGKDAKTVEFEGGDFYKNGAWSYRSFVCPKKDGSLESETFELYLIHQNGQEQETLIGTYSKDFLCEKEEEPKPVDPTPGPYDCRWRGTIQYEFKSEMSSESRNPNLPYWRSMVMRGSSQATIFVDTTQNQQPAFISEYHYLLSKEYKAEVYHGCRVGNRLLGKYTPRMTTTQSTNFLSQNISDAHAGFGYYADQKCYSISAGAMQVPGGETFLQEEVEDRGCNSDPDRLTQQKAPWTAQPRSIDHCVLRGSPAPKKGDVISGQYENSVLHITVHYNMTCF